MNATADFQRSTQLDFLLALFRPWLTKGEAAFLLDDCSEDHVLDLIDEGKLRAINIAADTETRREIRIYRYSLEHRVMAPRLPMHQVPAEAIIPHHRPTVLCRELAEWLACTERHIRNLALDGPRDSHDTRHRIWRESAVQFLTSREIQP
jgi:hypothetical protein